MKRNTELTQLTCTLSKLILLVTVENKTLRGGYQVLAILQGIPYVLYIGVEGDDHLFIVNHFFSLR